jgi:hypothetical protein
MHFQKAEPYRSVMWRIIMDARVVRREDGASRLLPGHDSFFLNVCVPPPEILPLHPPSPLAHH